MTIPTYSPAISPLLLAGSPARARLFVLQNSNIYVDNRPLVSWIVGACQAYRPRLPIPATVDHTSFTSIGSSTKRVLRRRRVRHVQSYRKEDGS